jgi:hypothetical protein
VDNSYRLVDVVHRQRRDEVGSRPGKCVDLRGVVRLCLGGGKLLGRIVAVAARSDAAANDHRRVGRFMSRADSLTQLDRRAIRVGQLAGGIADFRGPIGTRPPGGRFEHQPHVVTADDVDVVVEIPLQLHPAVFVLEHDKRRKLGQFDAVVEHHVGLHAAVGHEQPAVKLGEVIAIFGHGFDAPCFSLGAWER